MILDSNGFIASKRTSIGRLIAVVPLTFGRARLTIGPDDCYIDDSW